MRMAEKCRNNNKHNSDNPLTSRRTDGSKKGKLQRGKKEILYILTDTDTETFGEKTGLKIRQTRTTYIPS